MNKNRIGWIDGVRGILTLWVIIFHYCVGFINKGYIGFASSYPEEEFLTVFIDNLPISIFMNNSGFPVALFMLLIAFIPAYKFFGDHAEESIIRQAKKRYVRFMIPTFLSFIFCFIFYHAGIIMKEAAGEALGSNWLVQIMDVDHSFLNLLYDGLIGAYVKGSNYVSASWIIGYLFIGSFISYGVLLLFGRVKKRTYIYIALFIFFFVYDQMYLPFITGIIAADIVKSREINNSKALGTFAAVLLVVVALALGCLSNILLPAPLGEYTVYAIACLLLIVGLAELRGAHRFLDNKVLRAVSNASFSAIMIHIPVMVVVSCGQYLWMANMGVSKELAILSVFLAAIPIQIVAIFLFHKLVGIVQRFVEQKVHIGG